MLAATDWVPVAFDGSAAAVMTALIAGSAAYWASTKQIKAAREDAKVQARVVAARSLLIALDSMRRTLISLPVTASSEMLMTSLKQASMEWHMAWDLCTSVSEEVAQAVSEIKLTPNVEQIMNLPSEEVRELVRSRLPGVQERLGER